VLAANAGDFLVPLAIIFVGLSLLTNRGARGADDATINSAVIWWGSDRRTTSQRFEGGSLSAGGVDVKTRTAATIRD
jgi:hypothetical protein